MGIYNTSKENEPKNIKFYSNKIEKEFNNFEINYIWEFILDNQNTSIIYNINLKLNKRKILFNQRLIKEEINNENKYIYEFHKSNHIYKIVHEKDIPDLYIDFKYIKILNSFQDNNSPENSSIASSTLIIIPYPDKSINEENSSKCKDNDYNNNSVFHSQHNKNDNANGALSQFNNNFQNNNISFGSLNNNISLILNNQEELSGNLLINIKFFNLKNKIDYPIKKLFGLLNLCFIKYISNYFENEETKKALSPEIKRIILELQKNINFGGDNKENIIMLLNENKGNNILIYSQYINEIFDDYIKIKNLINLLEEEKRKEIDFFWGYLSNYNEYSIFFEKEFEKDLKKTKFDYSLISLAILEKEEDDREKYKIKREICHNIEKKILYYGTQIDPIFIKKEFKYNKKAFYGMGIYFSDIIDYIAFHYERTGLSNRRENFGSIVPVNSTFSFIASEVFYDKNKFKQIQDMSLYVPELDHFPSYNELIQKYYKKMIEPNGIHFIRVNNEGNALTEKDICDKKKKGEFMGNEYAITEKYQIFPIYSLTVKRNEYFVLWRDPNFKGKNDFSDYLKQRKLFCMEKANMNIYFESSTEESLKFLLRRKYNKVILITSIGLDLSGKRFVEIARKIFGFNLMVLFFSANQEHLKWIQKFQNCLYTDQSSFYEEYITNFNKEGLEKLKKDVENEYNITLMKFSENFLSYPNFKNEGDFSSLDFSNNNEYIRHAKICCKQNNLFVNMNKNGNVELSKESSMWDITIIENEITLFSNGYYLDVTKKKVGNEEEIGEELIGYKYMIIWNFQMDNNYYIFYYPKKDKENILSSNDNILKVNQIRIDESELFDIIEE